MKIEAALILEGLSSKAKKFTSLIKKIIRTPVPELYKVAIHGAAMTEAAAPKGELAEVARGKTHRVVKVRFKTTDGDNLFFYFVIPLAEMSGKPINDRQALSSIQKRIKDIFVDLQKGYQDVDGELDTIYQNLDDAMGKLKEIDAEIITADQTPIDILKKDRTRHILSQFIERYYPEKARAYIAALAALEKGTIEKDLRSFSWNASTIPLLTRSAAAATGDMDMDDPIVVKIIAGIALATMTTQVLDAKEQI